MNVKLPDELEEEKLNDLIIGESVYTVPWAMYVEVNGDCWLNGNYSFSYEKSGTLAMKVTRVSGGVSVDLKDCQDHSWSRDGCHHVGGPLPIPVVEIIK